MSDVSLTKNQQEILKLIRKGKSVEEIAAQRGQNVGPIASVIAGMKRKGVLDENGKPVKASQNGATPAASVTTSAPTTGTTQTADGTLADVDAHVIALIEGHGRDLETAVLGIDSAIAAHEERIKALDVEKESHARSLKLLTDQRAKVVAALEAVKS